uniref:Uncharacterized protein n=1 Tax=Grammatophora oceanica TaxID=210454 RepID=A0A7S1UWG7_9STRA|mmetsp:Transcript_27074/g.39614  ORF Transcript_27074/g.39614 Transcript_27074/m.39614 type:complete len:526 (+) Transcript_27074:583-2160(+)
MRRIGGTDHLWSLTRASFVCSPPQFPSATSTPNKKGKIPLHYAAREGRSEVVNFLLSVDPDSAAIRSEKDKLALHFAAGEGHVEVVRALLRVNPSGASILSAKGKLPIHFASRWGHMQIAHDLLSLSPRGIREVDFEGSLPIHEAAREGQVVMAQMLMERYPHSLTTANFRGEIPLFCAVRRAQPELALVLALLEGWPLGGKVILQSVSEEDNVNDWDPVVLELCLRGAVENFNGCHLVAGRTRRVCNVHNITISRINEDAKPSSCCTTNACREAKANGEMGPTSGQRCCRPRRRIHPGLQEEPKVSHSASLPRPERPKSPFIEVATAAPGNKRPAAKTSSKSKRVRCDTSGAGDDRCDCCDGHCRCPFLPIHAALLARVDVSVLKLVMERGNLNAFLGHADCQRQLPLHLACSYATDEAKVKVVLERIMKPYPSAVVCQDNMGRLPFHVAVEWNAHPLLIEALAELNRASVLAPFNLTPSGRKRPPFWVAAANDCDLSTIHYLLRLDPGIIKKIRSKSGRRNLL